MPHRVRNVQAKGFLRKCERAAYDLLSLPDLMMLDDKALESVQRRVESLNTTNCSWALYAVREPLLDVIRREVFRRKRERKAARGGALSRGEMLRSED